MFEAKPTVTFEHGAKPGNITITLSVSGLKGTITASVNADGQLTTTDPSTLLLPLAGQINGSVTQINDWFKHKGKKLKPAVLKQGGVTLEKTPIPGAATAATTGAAAQGSTPEDKKPAVPPAQTTLPDQAIPPAPVIPPVTEEIPYQETKVEQPPYPKTETFKRAQPEKAERGRGVQIGLILAVLTVIAVGILLGAMVLGQRPGTVASPIAQAPTAAPPTQTLPALTQLPSVPPPTPGASPETSPTPVVAAEPCTGPEEEFMELAFLAQLLVPPDPEECEFGPDGLYDEQGDQFTQDSEPPGLTADWNDIQKTIVTDGGQLDLPFADEWEALREYCGQALGPSQVQVLCHDDLVPAADRAATLTLVQLGAPQPPDGLFAMGLSVRYDDEAPGAVVPPDLPLRAAQGAQILYTAPATIDGTFLAPQTTDFRVDPAVVAPSNHIQLVGPDWFAYVTFDEAIEFLPWICQFDDTGLAGAEHQACDIPGQAIVGEPFRYLTP